MKKLIFVSVLFIAMQTCHPQSIKEAGALIKLEQEVRKEFPNKSNSEIENIVFNRINELINKEIAENLETLTTFFY